MQRPAPSALELMRLHCETCYVLNDREELLSVNDWLKRPAPLFWLGITRQGPIWRFRADVSADVRAHVDGLIGTESFDRSRIHDLGLLQADVAWAGPVFCATDRAVEEPGNVVVEVQRGDERLLEGDALEGWVPDIPYQQPMFAACESGRAVAVCASVRISSAAHEVGVETLTHRRRRGFALSAVSAWTRAVKAMGLIPLYSTSWDNEASQGLAARCGYKMIGWEYRVDDSPAS